MLHADLSWPCFKILRKALMPDVASCCRGGGGVGEAGDVPQSKSLILASNQLMFPNELDADIILKLWQIAVEKHFWRVNAQPP